MSALAKAAELAKSTASVPHTSWPPVDMLLPLLVQPHTCCCSRRKAARFSPAPHSGGGGVLPQTALPDARLIHDSSGVHPQAAPCNFLLPRSTTTEEQHLQLLQEA